MTGGFAVLAYPVEYRNSGIMTFVIGKDGVVYQKDLGEKTTDLDLRWRNTIPEMAGARQWERKKPTPRPQNRDMQIFAAVPVAL